MIITMVEFELKTAKLDEITQAFYALREIQKHSLEEFSLLKYFHFQNKTYFFYQGLFILAFFQFQTSKTSEICQKVPECVSDAKYLHQEKSAFILRLLEIYKLLCIVHFLF